MGKYKGTLTYRLFGIPRNLDDAIDKIKRKDYSAVCIGGVVHSLPDLVPSGESDDCSVNAVVVKKGDRESMLFYEITGICANGWSSNTGPDRIKLQLHANDLTKKWQSYMKQQGIEDVDIELEEINEKELQKYQAELDKVTIYPAEPHHYTRIRWGWIPRFAKPTIVS